MTLLSVNPQSFEVQTLSLDGEWPMYFLYVTNQGELRVVEIDILPLLFKDKRPSSVTLIVYTFEKSVEMHQVQDGHINRNESSLQD